MRCISRRMNESSSIARNEVHRAKNRGRMHGERHKPGPRAAMLRRAAHGYRLDEGHRLVTRGARGTAYYTAWFKEVETRKRGLVVQRRGLGRLSKIEFLGSDNRP